MRQSDLSLFQLDHDLAELHKLSDDKEVKDYFSSFLEKTSESALLDLASTVLKLKDITKSKIDARRFFILEALIREGNLTSNEIIENFWKADTPNRDLRRGPWRFYYNMTKYFVPMERSGFITSTGLKLRNDQERANKTFRITYEGVNAFVKTIGDGEIFKEPLYRGKEKLLASRK